MTAPVEIGKLGDDWDMISECDAFWAVLSDPDQKHEKWDKEIFFKLGSDQIQSVLDVIRDQLGPFHKQTRALDFGCGLGRLTRAMAHHFDSCDGIDISEQMIMRAMQLNADTPTIEFHVNRSSDLGLFRDATFDFIYSSLVLQHVPSQRLILDYIKEFVRVTVPEGIVAFQLPPSLPWFIRVQPRRKLFSFLKRIGIPPVVLYRRFGLHPIRMQCVPESRVMQLLEDCGAPVGHIIREADSYFHFPINTYISRKLSS